MKTVKLLSPNRAFVLDGKRIESGQEVIVSDEAAKRAKDIPGIDVSVTDAKDDKPKEEEVNG